MESSLFKYIEAFIEAFTHLVLYITNVYPPEYFEKKKKFNTLIWHCTNKLVEKYIQQAIYPIRTSIHKNLYKYRIILKTEKNEVLNIFTLEFEQLYKKSFDFNYSSFEQFVWDFFTYLEMFIYHNYSIEKTFEISIDVLEDVESVNKNEKEQNKFLENDWEIIDHDNLDIFDKKILKSMNLFSNGETLPICQIYMESPQKRK